MGSFEGAVAPCRILSPFAASQSALTPNIFDSAWLDPLAAFPDKVTVRRKKGLPINGRPSGSPQSFMGASCPHGFPRAFKPKLQKDRQKASWRPFLYRQVNVFTASMCPYCAFACITLPRVSPPYWKLEAHRRAGSRGARSHRKNRLRHTLREARIRPGKVPKGSLPP